MGKVTATMSISLDGYIAGPNDNVERLHEWMFPPKGSFEKVAEEMFKDVGAIVMGRRMFDLGEGPWGENPPFHMPVFVLTHKPRAKVVKEGGTTFTLVTEGMESTLKQAQAAARDKDVLVAGGANAVQQYLKAGVLDEIRLHLIPVLLGSGTRLFDQPGAGPIELESIKVIDAPGVTHLRFRVLK